MTSSLTSKGKAWEYRNSLWMLWTLLSLGFLTYVSFFYISSKVKQKKWLIAAYVYSVLFIMFMILPDFFTPIFIISWLVSIFHVIKIRTEYLLRLEAVQSSGLNNRELDELKKTIAKEYGKSTSDYAIPNARFEERAPIEPQAPLAEVNQKEPAERVSMELQVDINTASEQEIATVPGIGSIFAAKVVAVRNEKNGFNSFDHFVQALSIKPHLAEKMKSHVIFSNTSHNEQPVKKTEGRIVDF